jgi:tetratricopeptide (TPR) repeat protein
MMPAPSELETGLALLQERAFVEAAQFFRGLLLRDPRNRDAQGLLAWTLLHLGELDAAEATLVQGDSRPATPESHWILGQVYLEKGEVAKAHSYFDEAIARSPEDARYHASRANAFEREGKFEAAIRAYARAGELDPKFTVYKSLRFDQAFFETISATAHSPTPQVVAPNPATLAADHVVLVSADDVYLRKYAEPFLSSLKLQLRSEYLVHVHAMDASAETLAGISDLLKRLGITKTALTVEKAPAFYEQTKRQQVWYTCRRFYHLGRWLRQYQLPIAVLDIDLIVQRSLDPIFQQAAEADLGLQLRKPRNAPWLDLLATCVVANPTAAAERYFRLVGAYFDWFEQQRIVKWHLDQSALYCVLRMMQMFETAPVIAALEDAVGGVVRHAGRTKANAVETSRK